MKFKNVIWGIFFVIAGIVIIANQLGGFIDVSLLSLALTFLLMPMIILSLISLNFIGIFFPMAILGIIWAEQLNITAITPWPILAAATLLTLGFSIIFKRPGIFLIGNLKDVPNTGFDDSIIDEDDNSIINVNVRFGSSIKYVNSKDFKRGNLNCSFGALTVYFDNATLNEKGAIVNIDASFSGVELYIPKNWEVIHGTNATLGGIEEKNRNTPDGKNKLTITGNVSFAGIEITYI